MKHETLIHKKMDSTFERIELDHDPLPLCIEIHPTDFCNQGCEYCFGAGKHRKGIETNQRQKYMSLTDYRTLFSEMSTYGINNLSISGGGEPFLSQDIDGIYDLAFDHNLRVRTVTNGNVLNSSTMERVLHTQEIRFSIDSTDPNTYSKIRKVNPAMLQKTINNIGKLVEARNIGGYPLEIGATCIIGYENAGQIENFADLVLGHLGIDHVVYKYDAYGIIKPDSKDEKHVDTQLKRVKEVFGNKIDSRLDQGTFSTDQPCVESYFKSVLNPYGELFSCCLGAQPGETNGIKYGDIKAEIKSGNSNPLTTIWKKTRTARDAMRKKVDCTDCNFTDRETNAKYVVFQNDFKVKGT